MLFFILFKKKKVHSLTMCFDLMVTAKGCDSSEAVGLPKNKWSGHLVQSSHQLIEVLHWLKVCSR